MQQQWMIISSRSRSRSINLKNTAEERLPDSMASPSAKRLEGKVAVITGGASGIGAATARLFIWHGAKVVVADVQDDLGNALCHQIGSEEIITYIHCDVSSDTDVKQAVDLAVEKYGKLDIMFNNAGIGNMNPNILTSDNEEFKKVFEVNVFGGFLGAKHAARVMIPEKKGCILFTASAASVTFGDLAHAYVASKSAVVGMMKNLCVELGEHGIRVNAISPHGVPTPLMRKSVGNMEKEKLELLVSSAATLKHVILEEIDIAEAALYLASDESKYVSGLNLVVDGGFSLTNRSLGAAITNYFTANQS